MQWTYDQDTMDLDDVERAQIFAEGRTASLANQSPFTCPYIGDKTDERFNTWVEGYASVAKEDRNEDLGSSVKR